MILKLATASLVAIAFAARALAADPPSLADQYTQAQIDQIRAGITNDRVKSETDLLAAIRSTTAGAATVDKTEAGAEALLLTRRLYADAAAKVAEAIGLSSGSKPVVVIGDSAPTVADWYAFQEGTRRVSENLTEAVRQWREATGSDPRLGHLAPSPGHMVGAFISMPGAGAAMGPLEGIPLGIDAITSVASLFRYDTAITAAALPLDDGGMDALLAEALSAKGFAIPAGNRFEIPGTADSVRNIVNGMATPLRDARRAYGDYLQRLKAYDKADNVPPAIATAGTGLQTALSDYDAMLKAVYTPVAGVLPATLIDREAVLAGGRQDQPILYIRRHNAALTTTTTKNFFTSLSPKVPVYVSAAAEVDYLLVDHGRIAPGSVVCTVARVRLTDAAAATPACAAGGGTRAIASVAMSAARRAR